jgi:hypothetical protein
MGWPDFIICGSMKCGTTVAWHNLNKHPDIEMIKNPEDHKPASTEIRMWNDGQPYHVFTNKGIEWYKSLFNNSKCQGEKCANYIEEKSTMERMSKYIPNVKLILCIREPVSRAYSEFQMQSPGKTFTYEIAEKKGYLRRSKYYEQIVNHVLPFFSKENLHIIIKEQMKNNTQNVMNDIYDFIDVQKLNFGIQKVTSQEATNRNLNLEKDSEIKLYKVWQTKYEPINSKLEKKLKEYFKKHNEKLFEFLGYDIKEWKTK